MSYKGVVVVRGIVRSGGRRYSLWGFFWGFEMRTCDMCLDDLLVSLQVKEMSMSRRVEDENSGGSLFLRTRVRHYNGFPI